MAFLFGTDSSGNDNDWLSHNILISDSVIDTPDNNFAVLNAISADGATLAQGNLHKNSNTGSPATFSFSSGKWYCEVALLSGSSTSDTFNYYIGVEDSVVGGTRSGWTLNYVSLGMANGGNSSDVFQVTTDTNGTVTQPTGSRPDAVAIIGVAIDVDDGDVEFYINGTLNGKCLGITDWTLPVTLNLAFWTGTVGAKPYSVNFGQNGTFSGNVTAGGNADGNGIGDFKYSPPTGYLAMCTSNLPTPTITKPTDHFNTVIYTGDGTDGRTISGVGFQPDLLWMKNRGTTNWHSVNDAIRGVTKYIWTNDDDAEDTSSDALQAFTSDGFTVDDYADFGNFNANTNTYVAWNWKANGAGSSNTDGQETSTVSANTTSGFSIVKWTAASAGPRTVGHGLGVKPNIVIHKRLDADESWYVYTDVFDGSPDAVNLNSNGAKYDWNNGVVPTSDVFTHTDNSGSTNVAYCFASVDGYSKVGGTYVGNNNVNGPFVYCGFRPAWILFKDVNASESWNLFDNKRNPYNTGLNFMWADLNSGDYVSGTNGVDLLSNGFKLRANNGVLNGSTNTWIFVAFAESPFKYANAR